MGRPIASGGKHDSYDDDEEFVDSRPNMRRDGSRIISLHGDVTEHMISNVIVHLLGLAQINEDPIQLIISTYGGSVDEMFGIYDVIKLLPAPVQTIALGKVMSAGVLLLASGKKGQRMIGRSARIMIHPVSGGASGNIFQVENETEEMRRVQNLMVESLIRETKMSKTIIEMIMKKGKDYYVTPQEAIKYGIADRVLGDRNE